MPLRAGSDTVEGCGPGVVGPMIMMRTLAGVVGPMIMMRTLVGVVGPMIMMRTLVGVLMKAERTTSLAQLFPPGHTYLHTRAFAVPWSHIS